VLPVRVQWLRFIAQELSADRMKRLQICNTTVLILILWGRSCSRPAPLLATTVRMFAQQSFNQSVNTAGKSIDMISERLEIRTTSDGLGG
jgi:hypothetical protein